MLDCPQRGMQSLSPKISTRDGPCFSQLILGSSGCRKQKSQRDHPKVSQRTGFPLPGEKAGWPGNAPLEAFSGLQVSNCATGEVVLKQSSIFSLLCFAQHPMASKSEGKREKRNACFLSYPLCYPLVPHAFLSIASFQKRDFRNIMRC